MRIIETPLVGCIEIEPRVFGDDRGWFFEAWQNDRYRELGIRSEFVQDNVSKSSKGVLRGLHYQWPRPQGKLVQCLAGEVWDVAVDARVGSPTFGHWHGVLLSAENHKQFWVPEGFLHGFVVLSDSAIFSYKTTEIYISENDMGIAYDDPFFEVEWPTEMKPILSVKDQNLPKWEDLQDDAKPVYQD